METHLRCPNCGRQLTDDELYCYFCELEIEELKKKAKTHSREKH